MTCTKRATAGAIALAACLAAGLAGVLVPTTTVAAAEPAVAAPFAELLEVSLSEKRGLTFYVAGQAIPGVVVKRLGDDAVELRNQIHDRVVLRLDRVDAVALH